jgi:ribosomal protein S7
MKHQSKGHVNVASLFNSLSSRGSRKALVPLVANTLKELKHLTAPQSPLRAMHRELSRSRPRVNFISRKIAGVSHRIPVPFRSPRGGMALVYGWFKTSLRARALPLPQALGAEARDLLGGRSKVVKACADHHRLVLANRHLVRFLRKRRRRS